MYIHWKLFRKALRLGLIDRSFGLRHRFLILGVVSLYFAFWMVVAIARGLDHLLFPGFKKQEIRDPVFIVAPPRSGTTLTQKLMALDTNRFCHVTLLDTIFPSVTCHRLFGLLRKLDRGAGSPARRLGGWIERRFFGGWDGMHPLRFDQPEEDMGFFVFPFLTEAVFLLFPYIRELWGTAFQDALPEEDRERFTAFYRSCLQRHLYAAGPAKVLLSKSTQSSGAIRCLAQAFPDARLLTIYRHPSEAIPSHVSVFYAVWRTYIPGARKDFPISKEYAQLAADWYNHLFECRDLFPSDRYLCLPYAELVSGHTAAIERIYRHFGLALDDEFRGKLAAAARDARGFRSPHHYSIEEFGLTRQWLEKELGPIMDHYGARCETRSREET